LLKRAGYQRLAAVRPRFLPRVTNASLQLGESTMVAMMASMQRYCLPLLLIGALSGLLTLIPTIGWLLGLLVLILAWRYLHRNHFLPDLLLMLAVWMLTREFASRLIALT
jgi:hypothetical protein